MAMTTPDTNVTAGLAIIKTAYPNARMRCQLGCIHLPEALKDGFSGAQQTAIEALDWVENTTYGGYMFLCNEF